MQLGREELEAAVLGGAVLGGGGGGSRAEGLRLGEAALELGTPTLVPLDLLAPDALVATVALVGAPAARDAHVEPSDHLRAWELLAALTPRPVAGIITCENGGTATINGWLQSAVTGVPMVDAPADGRAHPTGDMGSLGLEEERDFVSLQGAAGGDRTFGAYLEQQVRAPLAAANRLVRSAADAAGGLVAVARNPVPASYLATRAAKGAISHALAIGRELGAVLPRGTGAVAERVCGLLGGTVLCEGPIRRFDLETRGGYDVGTATICGLELTIWNEFMTAEREGVRLATFPDLIVAIDDESALPVTSAELRLGRRLTLLMAPAASLTLGAGVRAPRNLAAIERVIGKSIIRFLSLPC